MKMRDLMAMAEGIEFKNELGNDIMLDISHKTIDDVDGVLIHIEGPTSETDNHITRKEAEIMHQELGRILSQPHDCETPGAMYDSEFHDHEVKVSVKLPPEITIPDMTDEQGKRFDDLIHNAMEELISTMLTELD